jgi:hypothetical protein
MPRTLKQILDHADKLAERFETYEPTAEDERDRNTLIALRDAAASRSEAERSVKAAVETARADGFSWQLIGSLLGTSGQAARQRYGPKRKD